MIEIRFTYPPKSEGESPLLPLGTDGPETHSFEPEMPLVLLEITRQVANAENFASHRRKIMFVKNSKLVSGNPELLQKLDTDSYKLSL